MQSPKSERHPEYVREYRLFVSRMALGVTEPTTCCTNDAANAAIVHEYLIGQAKAKVFIGADWLDPALYNLAVAEAVGAFLARNPEAVLTVFLRDLERSEEALQQMRSLTSTPERIRIRVVGNILTDPALKVWYPKWHACVSDDGSCWFKEKFKNGTALYHFRWHSFTNELIGLYEKLDRLFDLSVDAH